MRKKINQCNKHGRILLHRGRCHDCRNENLKTGTPNSDINYFDKKVLKLSVSDITNLILDDMEGKKTISYDDCDCLYHRIVRGVVGGYTAEANAKKILDPVLVEDQITRLRNLLKPKTLRCQATECKCYCHDDIDHTAEQMGIRKEK